MDHTRCVLFVKFMRKKRSSVVADALTAATNKEEEHFGMSRPKIFTP